MLYLKQKSPVGIKALLINKRGMKCTKWSWRLGKHANWGGGGEKEACLQTVELFPSQVCSDYEWMERSKEMRVPPAGGGQRGPSAWGCVGLLGMRSGGEAGSRPPDGSPTLGGLQQASVVRHDLVLRQVQVELQRHQDGELKGYQLSAVHSEPLLQFLWGDEE